MPTNPAILRHIASIRTGANVHDLNGLQALYQHISVAAERERLNGGATKQDLPKTRLLLAIEGILLTLTADNIKKTKSEVSSAMRLHYD